MMTVDTGEGGLHNTQRQCCSRMLGNGRQEKKKKKKYAAVYDNMIKHTTISAILPSAARVRAQSACLS